MNGRRQYLVRWIKQLWRQETGYLMKKSFDRKSDLRLRVEQIIKRLRISGNNPWDKNYLKCFVRISFKASAGGRPSGPRVKYCFAKQS